MEHFDPAAHYEDEQPDTDRAERVLALLQGRVDELSAFDIALINAHLGPGWNEGLALRNVKERPDRTYAFEDTAE